MNEHLCHCQDQCAFYHSGSGDAHPLGVDKACRVIDELKLLFEISQMLERSLDLGSVMPPVLDRLASRFGMTRGSVSLQNRKTKAIITQFTYGMKDDGKSGCFILRAQPYIRDVFASGKPLVLPNIREDPLFEDCKILYGRAVDGAAVSFLCAPIIMGDSVVGAISMEKLAPSTKLLDSDLRLLQLIGSVIARAVELRHQAQERLDLLQQENEQLQEHISNHFKPGNMVGNSGPMRMVYRHIEQVAPSNTTILLRGESGTGKELAAHAIHQSSNRRNAAFVKFNCAALPESIIESELFGHEKGAFTGALSMRKGRFEIAHGGTIFLDEIGDISPSSQVKLLRVLQEKTIERVGSHEPIQCDVRVIAATSRNLESMMVEQKFREDLYYRLNVFPIYIPPLRERKSDILQLADFFVEKYAKNGHKTIHRISSAAIDMLVAYHWPGNVRELENCIERAVLLCDERAIQAHHLPPTLQMKDGSETPRGPLNSALEALEQEMIVDTIKQVGGNISKAARELGLTERILGLRIRKYGIDPKRFKNGGE